MYIFLLILGMSSSITMKLYGFVIGIFCKSLTWSNTKFMLCYLKKKGYVSCMQGFFFLVFCQCVFVVVLLVLVSFFFLITMGIISIKICIY